MAESYYKNEYRKTFTPGTNLPRVSTDLDSVRQYQFEIHFFGLPGDVAGVNELTLAAKKVSGMEMKNETIVVDRLNDKLHYPGKTTPGELVVEFDNFYLKDIAGDLYRYFRHTYDPLTGEMTKASPPGGDARTSFKAEKVEIVMLDNALNPHSTIELYGVYPVSWTASEFNYSQNGFHTLTVNFKYDFMNVYKYKEQG